MAVGGTTGDANPDLVPLLHAHKGECLDQAEARLESPGTAVGTDEIAFHLACLVHNVRLRPDDLPDAMQMLDV